MCSCFAYCYLANLGIISFHPNIILIFFRILKNEIKRFYYRKAFTSQYYFTTKSTRLLHEANKALKI